MAFATLKRTLDWESLNPRPAKRRRCNPFKEHATNGSPSRSGLDVSGILTCAVKTQASPFANTNNVFRMSLDKMSQKIRDENKRLHRCKQLPLGSDAIEVMQDSESSELEIGAESPIRPDCPPSMVSHPEKALFTFKQVQIICEGMLKEREDELREKYDAVLATNLADQYDSFVKFTYDQIHRRYEAAPSYLS